MNEGVDQPTVDKINQSVSPIVNQVDDTMTMLNKPDLGFTTDPEENKNRILGMVQDAVGGPKLTMDDIQKLVNSGALGSTVVR
jgi:hypothetical protein